MAQGVTEKGESALKGGVWRAEALCRLRAKAFAAAGVCHLASITKCDQGLFDTALDKPALESLRPPTADEVMAVDRKAMTEAFRLVTAKEGTNPWLLAQPLSPTLSFLSVHLFICQAPWIKHWCTWPDLAASLPVS